MRVVLTFEDAQQMTILPYPVMNQNQEPIASMRLCICNLVSITCFLQLTSVPTRIGDLIQMDAISIHKNLLTSVPSTIGQLKDASRLSLYENELTEVPPEIGNMENLQEL